MPHRSPGVGGKSSSTMRSTATASGISTSTGCVGSGAGLACTAGSEPSLASSRRWTSSASPGGRPAALGSSARAPAADSQLVQPELRVRGDDRPGRLALAGLQVDDGDLPVGVQLDAVHRATQQDVTVTHADGRAELHLGADHLAAVGSLMLVPPQEPPEGGPRLLALALRLPAGLEGELVPDAVDLHHEGVDVLGELTSRDGIRERVHHGPEAQGRAARGAAAGLVVEEPAQGAVADPGERGRRQRERPIRRVQGRRGSGDVVETPPGVRMRTGDQGRASGGTGCREARQPFGGGRHGGTPTPSGH